jgi:amidase
MKPTLEDPFVPWIDMTEHHFPVQHGPLAGLRLAVKDVLDVAGLPTGCGHPALLAAAPPAPAHADSVHRLLSAGAVLTGKTHTDEIAYSIGGTNAHYGALENPAAPGRVTGGSSSGSAAAVAAGLADLGLGTDTAGSVRVPASYCGLYGLRPTYQRADRRGMAPLAPSFDTPGLLTRALPELAAAAGALLAGSTGRTQPRLRFNAPPELWSRAEPATREALATAAERFAARAGLPLPAEELGLPPTAPYVFSTLQSAEVWAVHGAWVRERRPAFGPGVAARMLRAEELSRDLEAVRAAERKLPVIRDRLLRAVEGTVLLLPASAGPAPRYGVPAAATTRTATVSLTCLAGLAGLPALVVPAVRVEGAPVGLCLVGAPGSDEQLLALAMSSAGP